MENTEISEKSIDNEQTSTEEKIEAITHKDTALKRLDVSFNKHIEASEYKKSNLLAYWIKDFSNYHDNEKLFLPSSLKNFKRGDIVKVNLGFNVGNELGGLHYCVVINKNDNIHSGSLNVIPLSSVKEDKLYNENTCINLGDELYNSLCQKFNKEMSKVSSKLLSIENLESLKSLEVEKISRNLEFLKRLEDELDKMKHGSIAYIHQITTISKQRIFKTPILSGIKLANESLDLIDEKIKNLFMK